MPNWVEGKLKIRGKPEDIRRWVEECLHCYTTNWLGDGALVILRGSFPHSRAAKRQVGNAHELSPG